MNQYELTLLGPIQVKLNGRPLQGFRSHKTLALLGYLAVVGQPVPREHLAGLFWGELTDEQARNELRRVLHNLTSLLPDSWQIDRQLVCFRPGANWAVDIALFRLGQKQGHLTEVAGLYGGELMNGLYLDDCPEFEAWLLGQREYWRQQIRAVWQQLIDDCSGRADFKTALNYANQLLAVDPWREETQRQVMLFLARQGERSAALRQYETCRYTLASELGVEPTIETTALYHRIREMGHRPEHNLPPQSTPFLGREKELAQLNRQLLAPTGRLLTIVGPGGAGKTRLLIEVTGRAVAQPSRLFLHGAVFIPLAGITQPDLLLTTIANALGLSLQGHLSPLNQLTNYLANKELLLALDNFEQLRPAAHLLTAILKQAAEVKMIVTSRERLNVQGEWVLPLWGMDYPAGTNLTALDYPAGQLFCQVAQRLSPAFQADPPAIQQICQLVGGIPLALELAAAWTPLLNCQQIVQAIQDNLDFLVSPAGDTPSRHQSLRAVFNQSWSLLTETEQQLLSQLTHFQGSFDLEAAQQVAGATPTLLRSLIYKSTVRQNVPGRYDLHPLLAHYAAEKMAPKMAEESATRHCHYYTNLLHRHAPTLASTEAARLTPLIQQELANIYAAWHWATGRSDIQALEQAIEGFANYLLLKGPYQEGEQLFNEALTIIQTSSNWQLTARLLGHLVILQRFNVNLEAAGANAGRIIDLGHQQGDPAIEARGRLLLGQLFSDQEQNQAALSQFRQALTLAESSQADDSRAWALCYLGLLSDPPAADQYLQQGLALAQQVGNWRIESMILSAMAINFARRSHYAQALDLFEQCLTLRIAIGDSHGELWQYLNLGKVAYFQGNYQLAQQYDEQALEIAQHSGDKNGAETALAHLGQTLIQLDQLLRAKTILERTLRWHQQEMAAHWITGEILMNLASIGRRQGKFGQAMNQLQQALILFQQTEQLSSQGRASIEMGLLYVEQGEMGLAQKCLEEAVAFGLSSGSRHLEGWALFHLADWHGRQGNKTEAIDKAQAAQLIAQTIGNQHLLNCCQEFLFVASISSR